MSAPPPPRWAPPGGSAQPPPPAFSVPSPQSPAAPPQPEPMAGQTGTKRKRTARSSNSDPPPSKLRAIFAKHSDMSKPQLSADRALYLGALKYLPHAVYKLLENMPAPWQNSKPVRVLYHTSGAITFVDEIPYVDSALYTAQWGQMWQQMQAEKRDRTQFRRMRLPPFDDEEPPMVWKELAELVPKPPAAIPLLSEQATRFEQLQFSKPFAGPQTPPALFDTSAFIASKEIDVALPNGPNFDHPDAGDTFDSSALDDPQRMIVRPRQLPMRAEARVAFPNLYGPPGAPSADPPAYALPVKAPIERNDNLKAFFVDSSITLVPAPQRLARPKTSNYTPFLGSIPLDQQATARALACYHAPFPFNEVIQPRKRAQDVTLVKSLYTRRRPLRIMAPKTRQSYQRLLKRSVKMTLRARKQHHASKRPKLLKVLAATKFFEHTKIDWLEAGMQLCRQGHQILLLMIHRRGLHFMHLDYNFNLKPTKTLTTKERKRSRFGHSFHLIRELLKTVKLVVDAHIQFRLGNVDAFELADGLHYIFTHMGQLTGIYRYKYKVMHQITACNDLKHVIYDRFNLNGVGKGPGCGIWQPAWGVWLAFIRGSLPMLERWLGNLVTRQFHGRVSKGIAKTVTKQRVDSHYDLEIRAAVLQDILDAMPASLRQSKAKVVMQHLSEAWRCWKANIPWEVAGMPRPIQDIIERYIKARADHWIQVTKLNREKVRSGATVDKAVARKNLGRMTRLWLRSEQDRQQAYALRGPFLEPENAVVMYKTMAAYLEATNFGEPVKFPEAGYPHDTKLLTLALENLRDAFNMTARLNHSQKEELALIEQAYDNPHDMLARIKRALLTQRVFKESEVSLLDFFDHLSPVYSVDATEKIVDAYLDQFLWYSAYTRRLFPSWVKPSDDEVPPIMVRKFASQINGLPGIWSTSKDESAVVMHLQLSRFIESVDFTLLNRLLKLIVDENIADYISAKMNAALTYKDMSHVNLVGIIRGFQFSSFVVQYYLLMVDILLLGLPRALDLARGTGRDHPVRAYCRHNDDVYMVFSLSRPEAIELMDDNQEEVLPDYPIMKSWSRDKRMRLIRRDMALGRALYAELNGRVPEELGDLRCIDASVYSVDNPALMFEMAGFEIRIEPKFRAEEEAGGSFDMVHDSMWHLTDPETEERTGFAMIRVSQTSIDRFRNRVRQIVMSSGSTTFVKIVRRWNTALTALVTYFREAAIATPELLDTIVKCETRVQNKVKMGLNSKMPARFPPCVFYSPEELGGLGMLSASHILIPSEDVYSGAARYRNGAFSPDEQMIPNLFRYVTPWETEAIDSRGVWAEYAHKRSEAMETGSRISLEELEDIWNRGLPRINTLFQKDRQTLAFDKGFRSRQEFKTYSNIKYDPFWWTNSRHDGRLWNFTAYRADAIQSLGGIPSILEHTMFKGTGFENWEGLFWQKQSGFEAQMQAQKLTNAQRSGLSQIPNRRFTLWWSPTINRANVYVGFRVQLDLTGIFLHGKIPTLKISYIQVFRAHLWQKIHESLVMDLTQILDKEQHILMIDGIQKLPIHPRKSYRMNASAADILLTSTSNGYGWPVSKPSSLGNDADAFNLGTTKEFWIDIQLRYGDYDSHDIVRYTRAKYLDYTTDGVSLYPSRTGVMVCVDLAYNSHSAFGNWIPGLKQLLQQALKMLMQANPALHILRERIRKALQLYQAQPKQLHLSASNFLDMMEGNSLLLDDSAVYRVTQHRTANGNTNNKPINGALMTINPSTGQLYMSVIHAATAWAGQKRLSALSKWKTAEETGTLMRTLPQDQHPQQIFISSRGLKDPLEVHMLDHSDIAIRNSELSLPFKALLQLEPLKQAVDNATESHLVLMNLYDDWLTISQPSTAFSRLMLLVRGLLVRPEQAQYVLHRRGAVKEGFLWPALSRDEWMEVESEMSEVVVQDYAERNGVDARSLTQSEIRDIILGQSLASSEQDRDKAAIESSKSDEPTVAVTTKTQNVHGDEITVVTTSRYEQQAFESQNTWRNRALLSSASLHLRAQILETETVTGPRISIPRNLIESLVEASDVRNLVIGVLYGTKTEDGMVVEAVAIVPQLGSALDVSFSPIPSAEGGLPGGAGLETLGLICTQPHPSEGDGAIPFYLSQLATRDAELDPRNSAVVVLNFMPGSIKVSAFNATASGIKWGRENHLKSALELGEFDSGSLTAPIEVTFGRDEGFFYVPEDDIWNYGFLGAIWNPNAQAFMKVGLPIGYYDGAHRPRHFVQFGQLESKQDSGSIALEAAYEDELM